MTNLFTKIKSPILLFILLTFFQISISSQCKEKNGTYDIAFTLMASSPILVIENNSILLISTYGPYGALLPPEWWYEKYTFIKAGQVVIESGEGGVNNSYKQNLDCRSALLNWVKGCPRSTIRDYKKIFIYKGDKYKMKLKKYRNRKYGIKGVTFKITVNSRCIFEKKMDGVIEIDKDWDSLLYNPGFYVTDLDSDGCPEIIVWYMSEGSMQPLELFVLSQHPDNFKQLNESDESQ